MIDDVSIIIPTYNRPSKLIKTVRFLFGQASEKKVDLNIIVADSSDESIKVVNRKNLMGISDSLKYLEYHPDIMPFDKCKEVLEMQSTRYTVFCGDDDFLLVDAIIDLKCFLDSNKDYSIASGNMLKFNINKDNFLNTLVRRRVSFRSYPQAHITDSIVIERLQNHLLGYTSSWYSMHRTGSLKRNMEFISKHNIQCWEFVEILLTCFDLIEGKRGKTRKMQLLRESGNTLQDESGSESIKGDRYRKDHPVEYYGFRRDCIPQVSQVFRHYLINKNPSFDEKCLAQAQLLLESYLHSWIDKKSQAWIDKKSQSSRRAWKARKLLDLSKWFLSEIKEEISSIKIKFELRSTIKNEYGFFKRLIN